jgi:uncharacterized protein YbjT (DUF2867 family)
MRVAVTGGTGPVGGAVLRRLAELGQEARNMPRAEVGDLGPETDWSRALTGAEIVIHCAARVASSRPDGDGAVAGSARRSPKG